MVHPAEYTPQMAGQGINPWISKANVNRPTPFSISCRPPKLGAVRGLLEVMIEEDDGEEDELTEQDRRALSSSREYFRRGGKGIPFEQAVTDLGFSMDQIGGVKSER